MVMRDWYIFEQTYLYHSKLFSIYEFHYHSDRPCEVHRVSGWFSLSFQPVFCGHFELKRQKAAVEVKQFEHLKFSIRTVQCQIYQWDYSFEFTLRCNNAIHLRDSRFSIVQVKFNVKFVQISLRCYFNIRSDSFSKFSVKFSDSSI